VVAPANNKHTTTSFSQLNIIKHTISSAKKKKQKIIRIYTLTDLGLEFQNPNNSDLLPLSPLFFSSPLPTELSSSLKFALSHAPKESLRDLIIIPYIIRAIC
jgi:hypothetical protein